MIKRDQIEKEIKELELQLKLKRKELRSLGRKPGKRGGSWFLQNPQDWDKIFKDFEKLSIEVERKSTTNSLKPDSLSVFGFKESCEIQTIFIIDHEEFRVYSEKVHTYQVK